MANNKNESEQNREHAAAVAEGIRTAILSFMEERVIRNIPEELILEETVNTFYIAEDKAKIFLTIAQDEAKKKQRAKPNA